MRQAVGLRICRDGDPRALPWAGMRQAFGLTRETAVPRGSRPPFFDAGSGSGWFSSEAGGTWVALGSYHRRPAGILALSRVAVRNSRSAYSEASFFMMASRKPASAGVGYGMLQLASWMRTSWARSVSCSLLAITLGFEVWDFFGIWS